MADYEADNRAATIAWAVIETQNTSKTKRYTPQDILYMLFPRYAPHVPEVIDAAYEWTEHDRIVFARMLANLPEGH